jgi:replicative DNA helicase
MENENSVEKVIDAAIKEAESIKNTSEKKVKKARALELYRRYEKDDRVIPLSEVAERIRHEVPRTAYMTGFTKLDDIIGGFREEQLVIVSAIRKGGKTSFSLAITKNMRKHNPLWFSYEQSFDELVGNWLEDGRKLGVPDEETIRAMPHCFIPAKLEVDRTKTLKWIECRIVESIAKYDSKVVFIDHLHYLVNLSSASLANELRIVTQELKRMAKKWKVVIVVMAHTNKNAKLDVAPTTDDIADASAIAQEADIVMMLWRKAEKQDGVLVFDNILNVNVQANRRTGMTGFVNFEYKQGVYKEIELTKEQEVTKKGNEYFRNNTKQNETF